MIDDPELLRSVGALGGALVERIAGTDGVREVRGRGLMIGVGLADGIDAAAVASRALDAGLVINVPAPDTLRLLPPLTIAAAEVERGAELLAAAIATAG